jgi:hypothetical protein
MKEGCCPVSLWTAFQNPVSCRGDLLSILEPMIHQRYYKHVSEIEGLCSSRWLLQIDYRVAPEIDFTIG